MEEGLDMTLEPLNEPLNEIANEGQGIHIYS
jgi:hypothetical protein